MILVVDDDPNVAMTIKVWLEKAGYAVSTAADGGQAYVRAKAPECECIVLDINMPNFNGPALLLVLQAEGVRVPAIVVTGGKGFSEGEMKQFDNVVGFFEKPVDMNTLVKMVEGVTRPETISMKE